MTETEIKQLQTDSRFSDGGLKNFYLLLYLPVGFVIAIIRIVVGLLVIILGNVLPDVSFTRNLLSHLFRAVFGIIVHTENNITKENVKVIIGNCVSPLDHFVAHIATGCISPNQTNLPKQLSNSLGMHNFGSSTNLEEIKKSIGAYLLNSSTSVLFQPESKITNGKGILKFKEWPFSFTNEVQPIYLKIRRPIFDISVTTITSTYWNDIFWYLFSPWTVYNLRFLTVLKKDDMDDAEFAEKVRQEIANALQVSVCPHDASEVIEWEKRYLLERRRARMVHLSPSSTSLSNNPELHRMARQVKEVLPAVPYNVIFKDLARTKNVDVTISNILEGHIPYTPEAVPSQSPTSNTPATTPSVIAIPSNNPDTSSLDSCRKAKDSLCTAASSFPKSAQERMQSFQERKMQLILNARKRYMDKHGISALASNNC